MGIFNLEHIDPSLIPGAMLTAEYLEKDMVTDRRVDILTEKGASGLSLRLDGNTARITYSRTTEFFRGLGIIKEWINENRQSAAKEEHPAFEHLTYMADCSRNAVCSPDFLKKLLVKLSLMGYDRLMLYTEDTYEVEGYPYFGHFRGRYSRQELRELDRFASSLGIEMVPCIQTLAHLNAIFRWPAFEQVHDTGDILLCKSEDTYRLIEAMIRTWSETFQSRIINIGMDEAEMIGRGAYLNRFGYEERIDIMERHLHRVLEICEKYGYTAMMWSDMFFKMISGGEYYGKEFHITEEIKKKIPANVELLYWDYYSRDEETYEQMMKYHRELAPNVGFAGGAWKWNGYAPLLNHSMQVSRLALRQCQKHGITNVLVTGWGDDGGEASQSSVLPVLSLFAEYDYTRSVNDCDLAPRLLACTGAVLQDFLKLDLPNLTPGNLLPGKMSAAPAKYLLYQDVLMGIYDCHVDIQSFPKHYRRCAEEFRLIAEKGGEYACVFRTLQRLSEVLAAKAVLGIKAKAAYEAEDRAALFETADACINTAGLVDQFKNALQDQWFRENKSFGYDVLDIRLGGLKERLRSCAARMRDYAEGKIICIEELEERRLPLLADKTGQPLSPVCDNIWREMVTASVI
ncbi:beta-N-acetylhexosaminidase [Blautia sp.]|uniref:beta-N-acetylhexosaminidase n=1 Tax=Blautia sp. TaxID=1955243 RepID=UPI00258EAF04|nr:beta-N-acetylhexosaminidase [Blautia sp.]